MNVKEVSMRKMRKSRMESAAIGVLPRGVCKVGASLHGIHNDVPMNNGSATMIQGNDTTKAQKNRHIGRSFLFRGEEKQRKIVLTTAWWQRVCA